MVAFRRFSVGCANLAFLAVLALTGHDRAFADLSSSPSAIPASFAGDDADAPLNVTPVSFSEALEEVAESSFTPTPCATWSITAEALILHRSHADGYGILYDQSTGAELFNANNLGDDTQSGIRLTLSHQLWNDGWLDIGYFGIDGWSSTKNFAGGDFFLVGDRSRSGPSVESASILYASRLHTAEINLRATNFGRIQPLAGFRWVRLGETYESDGLWDIGGGPTPYGLSYKTRNDLFGFQIGANGVLWDNGGPLRITAVGKAGIYYDDSQSDAEFATVYFAPFATDTGTERASFFGEVGVNATWQISRHVALRAGYQVYWLEGVALAPNQVLATDLAQGSGGIDADGGLLLHGANVGLEFTW